MAFLRAGQGDPRLPARDGESWADYIPRLEEYLRNGDAPPLPPPKVVAISGWLPYKEREPGEDG